MHESFELYLGPPLYIKARLDELHLLFFLPACEIWNKEHKCTLAILCLRRIFACMGFEIGLYSSGKQIRKCKCDCFIRVFQSEFAKCNFNIGWIISEIAETPPLWELADPLWWNLFQMQCAWLMYCPHRLVVCPCISCYCIYNSLHRATIDPCGFSPIEICP